jgi:hypothetical protein
VTVRWNTLRGVMSRRHNRTVLIENDENLLFLTTVHKFRATESQSHIIELASRQPDSPQQPINRLQYAATRAKK